MSSPHRLAVLTCATVFAALSVIVSPADARQLSPAPDRSADFMFGAPRGALGVRGSWLSASAGSDIFDFVTRQLTIDRGDFDRPGIDADLSLAITPRIDAQVGIEFGRMSHDSEYRDFVDGDLRPIEQRTSLRSTHVLAGVRISLTPRGQSVGRLAWIPRGIVPFIGAGGGLMNYEFQQSGDFVDVADFSVFPDTFTSKGWAPTAHVFGGVDLRLYRGFYATLQGRYTKASADLDSDFVGFDPIDLSGTRVSAGITLLF